MKRIVLLTLTFLMLLSLLSSCKPPEPEPTTVELPVVEKPEPPVVEPEPELPPDVPPGIEPDPERMSYEEFFSEERDFQKRHAKKILDFNGQYFGVVGKDHYCYTFGNTKLVLLSEDRKRIELVTLYGRNAELLYESEADIFPIAAGEDIVYFATSENILYRLHIPTKTLDVGKHFDGDY